GIDWAANESSSMFVVPVVGSPSAAAQIRGSRDGGAQRKKEVGHDKRQTKAAPRWRKPRLSGAATAGHRCFPAHDRSAVRWPRKVDQGARRGHALGYVHSAGNAEERVGRRSCY